MLDSDSQVVERRELEVLLLRSQRFEAIGTLAGGLAHDLNNLLAPIRMSCELLKRKNPDPDLSRFIDIVQSSNDKARQSIEQIRGFTRGSQDAQPERFEPARLLPLMRNFAKEQEWPDSIRLKVAAASDLPTIHMDPGQLLQALSNLLTNAREAIGNASGTVELQFSSRTFANGLRIGELEFIASRYLRIDVTDTGSGVSVENQAHIFDPFFSTKPKGSAPGLGLSVAAAVVSHAKGYIDLHSQPGNGARFTLYLPEKAD
ncbi:MAG: hypothetical protein JJU20_14680 [Opitutales bacterium]|nr:hypothetical protein [Opitutales bacterium]